MKRKYNQIVPAIHVVGPSIAYIPLTRGLFALVDSGLADVLAADKWFPSPRGKSGICDAVRNSLEGNRRMHRVVSPGHEMVDHKNGNPLDNRIHNLRPCTQSQNSLNMRTRSSNKSGYKGVSWHRDLSKWQAHIRVNRKSIYLGVFRNPLDAHAAYCEAAMEHGKEFARFA